MKCIIGIDPGLAHTGYGIINTDGHSLYHRCHGVIKTKSDMPNNERLACIYDKLKKVIREYKPEEAGTEKIFFAKNVKTAIPVSEAKGVIKLCLVHHHIKYAEYTPLEVKQAVLGRGRADKSQIKEMIRIIFKLSALPSKDHEADALAIALCHSHYAQLKHLIKTGENRV